MKCDKCIHKPICKFRLESTASVLDRLENCCCYVEVDDPNEFFIDGDVDNIAQQPIKKVVEVVHGEWIRPTMINGQTFDIPHCSACGDVPCDTKNYCPNCGAKMDGERKKTDD